MAAGAGAHSSMLRMVFIRTLNAFVGHLQVVELLLKQKGVDLNAANALGDTALHKAVWYGVG